MSDDNLTNFTISGNNLEGINYRLSGIKATMELMEKHCEDKCDYELCYVLWLLKDSIDIIEKKLPEA